MLKKLLKFESNRVRRNYCGGRGIDLLKGIVSPADSHSPEEWLASTVAAKNPGMPDIVNEGLSVVSNVKPQTTLANIIEKNRQFYLGDDKDIHFLTKILDSSMRLHVQAHPSKEFSKAFLNSNYGKLECYYILSVRENTEPYIRLGFQKAPAKEEWKRIIEIQDIDAMDACFEKISVNPGEVWVVPGGLPHAIGEGITMLEIMEPSDWVVRCEFEREGIIVPPEARFMGHDLPFCLKIFDYTCYSTEEIRKNNRFIPYTITDSATHKFEMLADLSRQAGFYVRKLWLYGTYSNDCLKKFTVGLVCRGSAKILCDDEFIELKCGEAFCIAAAACTKNILFRSTEECEICLVTNA